MRALKYHLSIQDKLQIWWLNLQTKSVSMQTVMQEAHLEENEELFNIAV